MKLKLYQALVIKYLAALLGQSRQQTSLQTKAVRYLAIIADEIEQPTRRIPAGFHLSVSEPIPET